MITADISNFSGAYSHLNSNGRSLNISRFMLARSVMTVGHKNLNSVLSNSKYRIGELLLMSLGSVATDNGYLKLTDQFMCLEQSEKAATSYQLGQGLTKATAECLLGIPWLIHLKFMQDKLTLHKKGTLNPKLIVACNTENVFGPDLIGFDLLGKPHAFEAKGRSSGSIDKSVLQHAINQVSQVISVNNITPETLVVCYYTAPKERIHGTIIDPIDDGNGIRLTIKIEDYIETYYSFFKKNNDMENGEVMYLEGRKFITIPIGVPHLYYGIDVEVYNIINNSYLDVNKLSRYLSQFIETSERLEDRYEEFYSIGLDGIILCNIK